MPEAPDRRSKPRIIVGADHTIRFSVKGHAFRNVRITNLSIDGCFAMVHRGEAGLFTQGTVLETLTFEHPELPQAAITAKVTFALGAQAGQPNMEFLGLGIHFAVMSEQTASDLRAYVARHQT